MHPYFAISSCTQLLQFLELYVDYTHKDRTIEIVATARPEVDRFLSVVNYNLNKVKNYKNTKVQ